MVLLKRALSQREKVRLNFHQRWQWRDLITHTRALQGCSARSAKVRALSKPSRSSQRRQLTVLPVSSDNSGLREVIQRWPQWAERNKTKNVQPKLKCWTPCCSNCTRLRTLDCTVLQIVQHNWVGNNGSLPQMPDRWKWFNALFSMDC